MPRIELISVPLFNPEDPYHWQFDNLPLKNLMRRQNLINVALDDLIAQTRNAIGTQGSLSNRLNQSLNEDGSLKSSAIDDTLHLIGSHTDDEWGDVDEYELFQETRIAPFVRMMKSEADKLETISSGATDVTVEIQKDDAGDEVVDFDAGSVRFVPSSSVTWEVIAPNKVKAHLGFPIASAHVHYYDQTPVHVSLSDPDYRNYRANSLSTPYIEGSLRVMVNGLALSETDSIYVPGALVDDPWTLLKFTSDSENGTFSLSAVIAEEDVIRVAYDIPYLES